jgi:hypothetical protein
MKTLFSLLLIFATSIAWAQVPTIVSAPILENQSTAQLTLMTSLQGSLATIEETEKKVERIKEKADWISQLKSVQEFITLMETIACMIRDLNVDLSRYNSLIGSRASCVLEFNYRINITKLRKSVDIINIVVSDGFSMDRGERNQAYEIAFQNFVDSQHELHNLQSLVKRKLVQYERQEQYNKSLESLYGLDK